MNRDYYRQYYELERHHWWFRARLEILAAVVERFLPSTGRRPDILNAGIATGATTQMLERFGAVTSLEYDRACCAFVREQLGLAVTNASLTELPWPDASFDLICAFDVLEHIEDDGRALAEIYRCLRPGGRVVLTVPAYELLWSEHDVVNHHYRRYTRRELTDRQTAAGLHPDYATYFNSLLFAPIAAVRLARRLWSGRATAEDDAAAVSDFARFRAGGPVNRLLFRLFRSEAAVLRRGGTFPAGVSVLTVATRPG